MKKNYVLRALIIVMALTIITAIVTSCSKEKRDIVAPPQTTAEKKLVESKNTADATDFQKFTYDAQGKLSKVESNLYIWNFEHQSSKMIVDYISKSTNTSTGKKEYLLDASGWTTQIISKKPDGSITYNQYIEYDGEGYLAKAKTVYSDGEIAEYRYTMSGGNAIREDYYVNDVFKERTEISYDLSIKNKVNNSMALLTWGIKGLYGKAYVNESNAYKRYNPAGTLTAEMNATIVTDGDGYSIKKTFVYPLTGSIREYKYTYQ